MVVQLSRIIHNGIEALYYVADQFLWCNFSCQSRIKSVNKNTMQTASKGGLGPRVVRRMHGVSGATRELVSRQHDPLSPGPRAVMSFPPRTAASGVFFPAEPSPP